MITEEHFEALRKRREEAEKLRLACVAATGAAAFLHIAFDRNATPVTPDDAMLLRSIQ